MTAFPPGPHRREGSIGHRLNRVFWTVPFLFSDLRREAMSEKKRIPLVEKICASAVKAEASDIHLTPGLKPMLRVHGKLRALDTDVLDGESTNRMMQAITPESYQAELAENGAVDFSFSLALDPPPTKQTFRVNVVAADGGRALTLRLVPSSIRTPMDLGVAPSVIRAALGAKGLVLVTGATGSGKSTTLASLVDHIACQGDRKIVTVEQPIEFHFPHQESIVVQREVPVHTRSFEEALRSMLRQDPDVIMVGELRELHEIQVALHAAESGHIVLSTVHTNSAPEAIDRLINVFPAGEQNLIRLILSQSLAAVVSQRLVPSIDDNGRVMVHEVLVRTDAVANLIRQGKTERIVGSIQTGRAHGMVTFDDHLLSRVQAGLVSREVALAYARDASSLIKRLESEGSES